MAVLGEKFAAYRERRLAMARGSHGHIPGLDDIDMLVLHISNICHMNTERASVMGHNADQAKTIARLEREKRELIKQLAGDGYEAEFNG